MVSCWHPRHCIPSGGAALGLRQWPPVPVHRDEAGLAGPASGLPAGPAGPRSPHAHLGAVRLAEAAEAVEAARPGAIYFSHRNL